MNFQREIRYPAAMVERPSSAGGGEGGAGGAGGGGARPATMAIAAGWSSLPTIAATEAACEQVLSGLQDGAVAGSRVDLAVVFVSPHHVKTANSVALTMRKRLDAGVVVGVSAEGVIAGRTEHEHGAGVAVLGFRLPGVTLTPFSTEDLPLIFGGQDLSNTGVSGAGAAPNDDEDDGDLAHLGTAVGIGPGHRATILLADPFSTPTEALLPAMARARVLCVPEGGVSIGGGPGRRGPIVGGLASAASRPRGNALFLNDRVLDHGVVGVSLAGAVRVDAAVSQGCRGFGPTTVITSGKGSIIRTLGGRPALEVINAAVEELDQEERQLLRRGLFLGRVVDEYKDRFGRDDFLIRNILRVSKDDGAIQVADRVRVGQTVRLHLRDAVTASEDLAMLMDAQALHDRPVGALLVSCNGRGTRLFPQAHHDAERVARLLVPESAGPLPGEQLAKAGRAVGPAIGGAAARDPGGMPALAGFFAGGEIGPVGDGVFLHGQTACAAIFRRG